MCITALYKMGIQKRISKCFRNANKIFSTRRYSTDQNPAAKTWKVLSQDVPKGFGVQGERIYPEHADIVIIGGGFIGAAVAYWLKSRAVHGISVVVLEKDIIFKETQRNLSLGTLTQHYSLQENIGLSQYSAEFMRNIKEHLGPEVDIQYKPTGSLVLASEKYADKMEENYTILKELGTKAQLLSPDEVKTRFPWMNTDDVKLGCIGHESEGTFDAWELHKAFLKKSIDLGTDYVNAEVIGFELENLRDVLMEGIAPGSFQKMNKVIYKSPDGEEHRCKFAGCVLAAGDQSGDIAKLLNIGIGDGLLSVPLPVTKREYNVYSIEGKALDTGLCSPIVSDSSGLWIKRKGLENDLLFGMIPSFIKDSKEVQNEEYFKNVILASLLNRIPGCDSANIKCVNEEIQDCNTYDNTGILGVHPYYNNLYMATGFGQHGCQHSPGIGRAIAELIIDSRFTTIDFTRFAFDRFLTTQPIVEFNVY